MGQGGGQGLRREGRQGVEGKSFSGKKGTDSTKGGQDNSSERSSRSGGSVKRSIWGGEVHTGGSTGSANASASASAAPGPIPVDDDEDQEGEAWGDWRSDS